MRLRSVALLAVGLAVIAPLPRLVQAEAPASRVTFELDIQPILTANGCNAGACHGKARGQNGFALSLLAFDNDFDYESLVWQARGRRVFPAAPDQSLVLLKASGAVPHGGGKRLEPHGPEYEIIRRWIATGLERRNPNDPVLTRVEVQPTERKMVQQEEQPLTVTAYFSDGSKRDVTRVSAYQSSESAVVGVNEKGLVKAGMIPGEAAIMARYMGMFATCNVVIPLAGEVADSVYANLPRNNFIDGLVWNKLKTLGLTPSDAAPEHTLLRRTYLDIIGRLPTREEARAYLSDTSPDKREKLIDTLLARPEYADHWANKWCDLLRPNPYRVGIKAVFNFDAWIREAFRQNKPYDQFVRELITAQGSTFTNGAVTMFRDRREPEEITTMVSQLFLGIRLECAKCHHHPFEVWGQDDFYSFAAYFSRIGHKGRGIGPPISGSEEMFFLAGASERNTVKHPLTGEVLPPRPLFGKAPEVTGADDPRVVLADWMTSPDNKFFAQVITNRVWGDLMGRGVVDPVDDLRATNPPSNGPLLDALAADFRSQGYDLKKLLKTIMTSHVYMLSSLPNDRNEADTRNYSRHYRQRLRAETLLDAVCDITGMPESYDGVPTGLRATQLWNNRIRSLFLDAFGRPDPNQDPPCERTSDTAVVQTLHMMNSPRLHQKVTDNKSRVAGLVAANKTAEEIIEELYLLVYARFPTNEEQGALKKLYERGGADRRAVSEDILWALLNTPEFMFKN